MNLRIAIVCACILVGNSQSIPEVLAIASDKSPCAGECYVKSFNLKTGDITPLVKLDGVQSVLPTQGSSNGDINYFIGCTDSGDDDDGMKCKFGSSDAKWRCMSYSKSSQTLNTNEPLQLNGRQFYRMVYDFTNQRAIVTTFGPEGATWHTYNCETGEPITELGYIETIDTDVHQGFDPATLNLYVQCNGDLYRFTEGQENLQLVWEKFNERQIFEISVWKGTLYGRYQNMTTGSVRLVRITLNEADHSQNRAVYYTKPIGDPFPQWKPAHYIHDNGETAYWVQQSHQNQIAMVDLTTRRTVGRRMFTNYLFTFLY